MRVIPDAVKRIWNIYFLSAATPIPPPRSAYSTSAVFHQARRHKALTPARWCTPLRRPMPDRSWRDSPARRLEIVGKATAHSAPTWFVRRRKSGGHGLAASLGKRLGQADAETLCVIDTDSAQAPDDRLVFHEFSDRCLACRVGHLVNGLDDQAGSPNSASNDSKATIELGHSQLHKRR